jgi:hypothetical protein
MPEIKNTFSQGKMNKDLDERLIPNGQYRHAENIDVTSSEDAGAGTVQNILGNTRVDNALVPPGDAAGCACVGSIANDRTNKLYWFIKCLNRDAILEFDQTTNNSVFIAVDTGDSPFLSFTGGQITGINIIDDFLFWTDGRNEPKKLNISKSSQENPSDVLQDQTHARLRVNDQLTDTLLDESHVTVIRKRPSTAPTTRINTSVNVTSSAIFEKVFPRFCFRYKYGDGEYSAFGPFTEVVFNPEYDNSINSLNAYSSDEPYNKAMSNLIESIELYDFVPTNIPKDVIQVDILYKQENSAVVYSVASIKHTDPEWNEDGSSQFTEGVTTSHKGKYVVDSENLRAALPSNQLLRPFDAVPRSALAQEVIGNRIVYGNYLQGYDFEDNEPGVNASYELRKSQDFGGGGLKSLKSLREYQLGVVLGDKYGRETPVLTSNDAAVKVNWMDSILGMSASKSLMLNASLTSELPEWADYYKFYVKSTSGEYYNMIMDKSYFPFTHSAFENSEEHFYISFPSADRNKIMEEDYIIAKKIYDGSDTQVVKENKYKVLDIKNEAPDAVKYTESVVGEVAAKVYSTTESTTSSASGIFLSSTLPNSVGKRIDFETKEIHIRKPSWSMEPNHGAPLGIFDDDELVGVYGKDLYISWEKGGEHSSRYRVAALGYDGDDKYELKLSKQISNKDARLSSTTGLAGVAGESSGLAAGITFKVTRRDLRSSEDFSGKFFVKIKHDAYLTDLALDTSTTQLYVATDAKACWLYGEHHDEATNYDETTGLVNSASESFLPAPATVPSTVVTGIANTANEWESLINTTGVGKTFFIDDMYFISSNPASSNEWYAKEAGEGWLGAKTKYRKPIWTGQALVDDGLDDDEVYIGWDASARKDLTPRPTFPIVIDGTTFENQESLINSMEGIVETSDVHSQNARRWVNKTIYGSSPVISSEEGPSDPLENIVWAAANAVIDNSIVEYDQTYTEEDGKFFMHLSFLAPGVDLVTITDLDGVTLQGKDSIANKLQGVWGGGIFTRVGSSPSQGLLEDAEGFGASDITYIEFEGNYNEEDVALEDAPSPLTGQGYDENFVDEHSKQWNPAFSDSGYNADIQSFVTKLKTANSKFKFKTDTTDTVYTIKSVQEKHLYNHTSWRMRWLWNGTSYEASSNSVEEAASLWADTASADGLLSTTATMPDDATTTIAQNLIDKIEDFGAANNRRTCYIIELDKNPADPANYDPREDFQMTSSSANDLIQFLTDIAPALSGDLYSSPTVWETEPQQLADLNIYYEASDNIPTRIEGVNREIFAPVGCGVEISSLPEGLEVGLPDNIILSSWDDGASFTINPGLSLLDAGGDPATYTGSVLQFYKADGSYTKARIFDNIELEEGAETKTKFNVEVEVDTALNIGLNWFNCFSFGNGIESNRIRDGFNEMQITSGARASATLEEPFGEEHRANGLIYSGIYNSNSGVNNLNQFITAEKITKDLNPTYGGIQKLFARSTDLVALCEDRVLKILANKDALFNADGNPQLVSSQNVLGQAVPFVGDYGISQHPESFASESYRAYFADKQRGAVLRLSMDGLTPISDAGMRDYFRDNLVNNAQLLGSYDGYNKQYNLTIKPKVFSTPIINDDVSAGEFVQEFTDNTTLVVDGPMNDGTPFGGDNTVAELLSYDSSRSIPVNPDLDSSTTIIHHPEIPYNQYPAIEPFTGWDAADATYTTSTSWSNARNVFGIDATETSDNYAHPDSPFNSVTGSGSPKFYINRYLYFHTVGWGASTDSYYWGGGTGGDSDSSDWHSSTQVYVEHDNSIEPASGYTAPNNLTNNGITFRGTIDDSYTTQRAYIVLPQQWASSSAYSDDDFRVDVPDAVLNWVDDPQNVNNVDYSAAQNNTIFNGEAIAVRVDVRANNFGDNTDTRIQVTLLDAPSSVSGATSYPVSSSLLTSNWAQKGQTSQYGGVYSTTGGTFVVNGGTDGFLQGYKTSSSHNFPYINSGTRASHSTTSKVTHTDLAHVVFFKFDNGTDNEDIVVDNLRLKIKVNNEYLEDGEDLDDYGELVLRSIDVRKIHALETPRNIGAETIAEQPNIPGEDIPAWIEAQHNSPQSIAAWQWNLNYKNELLYGIANPPEEITPTNDDGQPYLDENGNAISYLQGSNPVFPDGTPMPEGIFGALPPGTHPLEGDNSIVRAPAIEHEDAAVTTMDFTLNDNTPIVADNWYLVDVNLVDEDGNQITDEVTLAQADLQIYGVIVDNTDPEANFQSSTASTSGFFGEVSIPAATSSARNLKLLPAIQSEYGEEVGDSLDPHRHVLRGLFKANLNGSLSLPNHIIQIQNYGEPVYINSVEITNITDTDFGGGNLTYWEQEPLDYFIERAFVENTNEKYSHPRVYYKEDRINFYNARGPHDIRQVIDSIPATNDGYKLSFTVGNNIDTQYMLGGLKAEVNNNDFRVITTVYDVGDYAVTFNLLEDSTIFIEKDGEAYTAGSSTLENVSGTSGGVNNMVRFHATNDDDTYCSVSAVSLIDATNYFSLTGQAGEGVDSWEISGFDQTLENYIVWNDGEIQFNEAPTTYTSDGSVMIRQPIEENLLDGQTFNLSFDASIAEFGMGFEIRYYNLVGNGATGGEGFRRTFDLIDYPNIATDGIQTTVQIGAGTGSTNNTAIAAINEEVDDVILPNGCLIIRGIGTMPFTGTIDNIFLNRVITEEEFESSSQTISFSEDANGWVSFKSFIPENGLSLSNRYFTMDSGALWQHNTNISRNTFYGSEPYDSVVAAVLNQGPSDIKSFSTINYEGSQAAVEAYENTLISGPGIPVNPTYAETLPDYTFVDDATVPNSINSNTEGWYAGSILTDSSSGSIMEFIGKEGKWFNYIGGELLQGQIDTSKFNFQGLGVVANTVN